MVTGCYDSIALKVLVMFISASYITSVISSRNWKIELEFEGEL